MRTVLTGMILTAGAALTATACGEGRDARQAGDAQGLETVASFYGAMPTGVTVSRSGRVFVNYPRWGDDVRHSVAEVVDGREVAYPDVQINRLDTADPSRHFLSVQSVVTDPADRLWILDTGSILFKPSSYGGPKLVGIDLRTNKVFRTIVFPRDVAGPASYLNDVRFDLRRGSAGTAFITDSSERGPNGIVVVDLASGRSWRRLNNHPTTRPEPDFTATIEGQPFMMRPRPGQSSHFEIGSDGITISPDGRWLYYCALSGRRLYRVDTDALADPAATEAQVAATVRDLGVKGMSDGMQTDAKGRVYASDLEHNAILGQESDGRWRTVVSDPRMIWPDTLSISEDRWLYVIANQVDRQARFQEGKDRRVKPYLLLRTRIDAGPAAPGRR